MKYYLIATTLYKVYENKKVLCYEPKTALWKSNEQPWGYCLDDEDAIELSEEEAFLEIL